MSKRVVIVDDEPLWRLNLQALCAKNGDLEIVGEAETVLQAARVINEKSPDLVFLDIDLRGGAKRVRCPASVARQCGHCIRHLAR